MHAKRPKDRQIRAHAPHRHPGAVLALAIAILTITGCVTVRLPATLASASTRAGASAKLADDASKAVALDPNIPVWPERWGDATPGVGKGVIVPIDGPLDAWESRRHSPWHARVPKGDDMNLVLQLATARMGDEGYRFRMEGYGAFVFERNPETPIPDPDAPIGRSEPSEMFVFVSGRPDDDAPDDDVRVDIERTWFAYYDHRKGGSPERGDPGLGTILLLPGLFGIPEQVVDVVTSAMRQRGWNVIRMLAPPARFVEKSRLELDPDDETSPRQAAAELMTRIAETAYASEGAWAHVLSLRPQLADLPQVVFGGSGGGLALPAVVRREPTRYDAAVVVAGGANILDVVSKSTYTKPVGALDFTWKDLDNTKLPPAEVLEPFAAEYLRYAPLDGYHAGEWFGDTPVLIMQASGDQAVPVENSELLWSRLGEPEKWTITGNHLTIFMSLWLHTPRILDWIEAKTIAKGDDALVEDGTESPAP